MITPPITPQFFNSFTIKSFNKVFLSFIFFFIVTFLQQSYSVEQIIDKAFADTEETYILFTSVPNNVTVNAFSPSGAQVFYTPPTAIQFVNYTPVEYPYVSCNPASGQLFPVGLTTVTCYAYDPYRGQVESTSFTVSVQQQDTVRPVISLNGQSSITISQGSSYVDQGASANDNVDGNITSRISVSGSVNTNIPGTYTLTYRVLDTAGNEAVAVTRTVTVVSVPITVTLSTFSPSTIYVGDSSSISFTSTNATACTGSGLWSGSLGTSNAGNTGPMNSAGTYTQSVTCTSPYTSAVSSVTQTLTVLVKDTTRPVISLNGQSSITISQGSSYVDQGANANDNVDGNITSRISVSGSVNTNIPGTYTLTYRVLDTAGNEAVAVTRTVSVVSLPPVVATYSITASAGIGGSISSSGVSYVDEGGSKTYTITPLPQYNILNVIVNGVNQGVINSYTFSNVQGSHTISVTFTPVVYTITSTSGVGGSISPIGSMSVNGGSNSTFTITPNSGFSIASVVVDGVNQGAIGSYTFSNVQSSHTISATFSPITYSITSSASFGGTISPNGVNVVNQGANQSFTITPDSGFSIASVVVDGVNQGATSSYTFNNVQSGHTISATFVDIAPPTITVTGANPVTIFQGTFYNDPGAIAVDSVDGVRLVNSTGTVNTAVSGSYTIAYSATDVSGNTSTTSRTVIVISLGGGDSIAPIITVTGANPITVFQGSFYTDQGATAVDAIDGVVGVSATGTVDTSIPGIYTVTYSASDFSGNVATTSRNIQVVPLGTPDTTSPVISIVGANPFSLFQGSFYTDPGATSVDAVDGLRSVTTTNFVNTAIPGSYSVVYVSSDTSLNTTTATRTVDVLPLGGITIVRSSFDGNFFQFLLPSVASGTSLGVSGITTITDSNITSSSTIANSTIKNSTTTSSQLTNVSSDTSTIINSSLNGCSVTNSFVKNYTGTNCTVVNSIVDPTGQTNDMTGSIITGFSSVYASDVLYSVVSGSYIATSTITNSSLTNSTSSLSTIASSTLINTSFISSTSTFSTIRNADINNSVLASVVVATGSGPVTISDSVISGAIISGSLTLITNSTIANTTLIDAVIVNDVMQSGTILLPNGSSTVIVSPTTVNEIVNLPPQVVFATSTTQGVLTIIDTSNDVNASSSYFTDAWVYTIDFGDGAVSTSSANNLGDIFSHTYIATGTYTVTVTVTDAYGASSTQSTQIVITSVVDTIPPVITLNGSSTVSTVQGSPYVDLGATAFDAFDGSTTSVNSLSTVDTNVVGTYSVTYTATDIAGNTSQLVRSVSVVAAPDSIAPVITILGANPTTITRGLTYTDQGATALDAIDGDVTSSIVATSTVDTSIDGTYFVLYTVSDVSGNIATSTRTVHVVAPGTPDVTPPVITINGSSSLTVLLNTPYSDLGATALDDTDGVVVVSATGTVNISATGTYSIIYSATDSSFNTSFATRTVSVIIPIVDTVPPVVTLNGSSTILVFQGATYIELGAIAYDAFDDATTTTTIFSNTVDTNVIGTYAVTYRATDIAGNMAQLVRSVSVVAPPSFSIFSSASSFGTITPTGTTTVSQGGSQVYTITPDANYDVASLLVDGISVATSTSYTFTNVIADHTISASFIALSATTTVDTTAPSITLNGSSTITFTATTTYADQGATATDDLDGDVTSRITTTNPVDPTTPGTYTVTYTVSDFAGNAATGTRTVVVTPVGSTTTSDIIAPTAPSGIVVTTTATSSGFSTLNATWNSSIDETSLLGHSFVWSQNSTSTPDIVVETSGTSTSVVLQDGTWYFHVIGIDSSLNSSTVATYGPVILSTTPVGDVESPSGPTIIISSTHTVGISSLQQIVDVTWDQATDNVSVIGYSFLWDTSTSTTPDTIIDTTTLTQSSFLPNGTWYFHVIALDAAGNISTTTATFGPVIIATASSSDVTPPLGPTVVTSNTHVVSATSSNHTATFSWDDALDETQLVGYSFLIDNSATGTIDTVVETLATTTTATIPDGTWYFHVGAVDAGGNLTTPVITFGPLIIETPIAGDTVPPSSPVLTFIKTSTSTLFASWTSSTDNVAVVGYSTLFATASTTNLDSIIETTGTSSTVTLPDGSWYFHLLSVDSSLNTSAMVSGGPLVIDTVAPVLTLQGSSTMWFATGTPFVDPGVIAIDAIEGNISGTILASGTVDILTPGVYIITYSVTDSSGNIATPVNRTIHVLASPDTVAPVITLNGSSSVTVFIGSVFSDPGATALDAIEGNVTQYLSVNSNVNTSATGTYSILYTVSDTAGNIANATRTITVIPIVYHSIVASTSGQGTITPVGTTTLIEGGIQSYTITPNFGYDITDVLIDGVSVGTTTSYTFSNVLVDRTISVVFTAQVSRPSFNVIATASSSGSVLPSATSTVLQGDDVTITIIPNGGYYVSSLIVDGVSVATSTSYTFTNVNSDHTLDATFGAYPLDTTPPTVPLVSSPTHNVNTVSALTVLTTNWSTSTDTGSGLSGYSYVLDNIATTTPDASVDTSSTTVDSLVTPGTWYFHVLAIDNVGNVSNAYHFGPVLITDGTTLLTNTFIDGVLYSSYAPTIASGTLLGLFGTSTIINSNLVSPVVVTDSTFTNVTASSSQLTRVIASGSFFYNSALTDCVVTNSFLKNYTGSNCTLSDSVLDPVGVTNDVTGSTITGFSSVYVSDVLYSTISHSYIATSTISGSTIVNSTSTDSSIASSTITQATISDSTITSSALHDVNASNSNLTNVTILGGTTGVTISSSTLEGTTLSGSSTSITNSVLGNTTLTDAVILNNIILSGSVLLPGGTSTVIIATATPVGQVINIVPVVTSTLSSSGATVTIVDTSSDANATPSPYLTDSWTYVINYGDGITSTITATTLGSTFTHTYSSSGTYTVTVTVIDAYGASSTHSSSITVLVPGTVGGGGGSSSSSGGGGFVSTSPYSVSSQLISVTPISSSTSKATSTHITKNTRLITTSSLKSATTTLKGKSVVKNPSSVKKSQPVAKASTSVMSQQSESADAKTKKGFWGTMSNYVTKVKTYIGSMLKGSPTLP